MKAARTSCGLSITLSPSDGDSSEGSLLEREGWNVVNYPCLKGVVFLGGTKVRKLPEETERRCRHRSQKIAWCGKLNKFCNAPYEYETCPDYEPRP